VSRGWLILLALFLALPSLACRSFPLYEYRIDSTVLQNSPVRAAGEAVASAEQVSSFPEIRIDPSGVSGYENLPESVRQLYETEPLRISIADVINQLLANSRDIKIEGYTLQVADFQIPINKSIYDLLVESTIRGSKDEQQLASSLGSGLTLQRDYNAQLTQLIPTGAVVSLLYEFSRTKTSSAFALVAPSFTQRLTASSTQPVLRGCGPARWQGNSGSGCRSPPSAAITCTSPTRR